VEKLVHGFLLRVKEFTSTRNFYWKWLPIIYIL
jgi:hypothetical protein